MVCKNEKNIKNPNKSLLGTCWGGGFFDGTISLSEKEGYKTLLISEKTAKKSRFICSNDISNSKVINDGKEAHIENTTTIVKKYVLTLKDGKVLICTVIKGTHSDTFEKIIYK